MINRLKALVLVVFAAYWVTVVVILTADRSTFDQAMRQLGPNLPQMVEGNQTLADAVALLVLTALFCILSIGVIRSWRWAFWLILIAFLVNSVRVPLAVLQILGIASSRSPTLIVTLQLVAASVMLLVALAMLAGYRKAGIWGERIGHR